MTTASTSSELWQYANDIMCVGVFVADDTVTDAAPIVRKFIGQPVANLERWMRKRSGFRKTLVDGAVFYSDFPAKPKTEVWRKYDPRLYGFPPGTLPPLTAEAARRGEHRRPSLDAALAELSF